MRNLKSPVVVMEGLTFKPAPICRASSFTPVNPPNRGTTALLSSATANRGGS
ncbi:hypothetical protein CRD_01756 [Raphidiopsis brookii D9]|nr:hypothetical protein CRD_01756 [Raphidiopsis brookii D9]